MKTLMEIVVEFIKSANGERVTTLDIVRGTGLTNAQVGGAVNSAINRMDIKVVRLVRGVFCYDPPEGTILYETRFDAAARLLREHGEIDKQALAKELDISEHTVHEVIGRARREHKLKVKRHVVYRLEK